MTYATARLFDAQIKEFTFVFSTHSCISTIVYFTIMFAVSLLFNVVTISRYKLIDLIGIDPDFQMASDGFVADALAQAVEEVLIGHEEGSADGSIDALFAAYPPRSTGHGGTSVEDMLMDIAQAAAESPAGNFAPSSATIVFKPWRQLGAPHTICKLRWQPTSTCVLYRWVPAMA